MSTAPKSEPTTAELRDDAIRKLQQFLQRKDLDRSLRVQAMFRLAALEDDAARAHPNESGSFNLEPAITLYLEILRNYPEFEQLAAIHYFLGHALVDSGRVEEGIQLFRVLVCRNHFTFVPSTGSKAGVTPQRLPQDHDAAFWKAWEVRHPLPVDRSSVRTRAPGRDEMTFVNPYPQDCVPISDKTSPGQAPKFLGETWWRLGDYHFNQIDTWGGPYNLNRAVVAYRYASRHGDGRIRALAMYKLGWTYFKQQRHAAAVEQFVEFLQNVDELQARVGGFPVDLRQEACSYIALSLTFMDFRGPELGDPHIPRDDVLDTEKEPRMAEQKMHVAIDRLQYPKIVPQNEPWTKDIYASLIEEFLALAQYRNMIEVSELFLSKWPTDPRANAIRQGIDQARVRLGKP